MKVMSCQEHNTRTRTRTALSCDERTNHKETTMQNHMNSTVQHNATFETAVASYRRTFFKLDLSPKAQSQYVRLCDFTVKKILRFPSSRKSFAHKSGSLSVALSLRRKIPVAAGDVNTHPTGHFITQSLGGMGKCSDYCCGF